MKAPVTMLQLSTVKVLVIMSLLSPIKAPGNLAGDKSNERLTSRGMVNSDSGYIISIAINEAMIIAQQRIWPDKLTISASQSVEPNSLSKYMSTSAWLAG